MTYVVGLYFGERLLKIDTEDNNEKCGQKSFVEKVMAAATFARRTRRVGEFARLFGQAVGDRVRERLLRRFGMEASDTTVLRQIKRRPRANGGANPVRVVVIDGWQEPELCGLSAY